MARFGGSRRSDLLLERDTPCRFRRACEPTTRSSRQDRSDRSRIAVGIRNARRARMRARLVVVLVLILVGWFGVAHAEDPPAPQPPTPDAPPSSDKATEAPTPPPPAPAPVPSPTPPATSATPATPAPVSGPTIVTGRVTDVLGRPMPDVRVYVLPTRMVATVRRCRRPESTGSWSRSARHTRIGPCS